jgi:hypothetical protein
MAVLTGTGFAALLGSELAVRRAAPATPRCVPGVVLVIAGAKMFAAA